MTLTRRGLMAACGLAAPAIRRARAAEPVYRKPWLQPFAASSVWNTPIGSGAKWSDPAEPGTAQLVKAHGVLNTTRWSNPHYIGRASDPLVVVTCADPVFPLYPQFIHVPIHARPDPEQDAHMTFFDLTRNQMWSYAGCKLKNGRDVVDGISAALGGVYDWCGNGILTANPHGCGDYNFAIGCIRDHDLAQGRIQHMLRYAASPDLAMSGSRTGRPDIDWMRNIPWPDRHEDWPGDTVYKGKLLYGSTIGIPAAVDLDALHLSRGGRMIADALQQYGAVMRDTGGQNSVIFTSEPLCSRNHPELVAEIAADLPRLVPHLRVLKNQGPHSINGGGRPLVPGPPPLDPAYCSRPHG